MDTKAEAKSCPTWLTESPTIHNPPLPAEGPGRYHFSNAKLFLILVGVPTIASQLLDGGMLMTAIIYSVTWLPILASYWIIASRLSPPINDTVKLPGRPISHYLTFHSESKKSKWSNHNKIPIHTFSEMYVEGKVSFNGDALSILECRHDWASFAFTLSLCRFIVFTFFRDALFHTRAQDMEQVRPNYDQGDDHYSFFLGPRMIYTSGIISDVDKEETLEELQDNKLAIVCEKLHLRPGDSLLDIGCGWGTLVRFASQNYSACATGVTLSPNQTAWGNAKLRAANIPVDQSRILCMDYRDIPSTHPGTRFSKITQLEMAEHVGVRRLTKFFRQCYDMLEEDGSMFVQVSGLRQAWQYEDFSWGVYLNKYIFRGADASTPLWNYVRSLERAGFEVKSVDTVGVHYSATLWRWYRNWIGNREKVEATFGGRWYRIWELFLAWSTIASRQGSAACFQIVVVKNLNSMPRINGVFTQYGLKGALEVSREAGKSRLQ